MVKENFFYQNSYERSSTFFLFDFRKTKHFNLKCSFLVFVIHFFTLRDIFFKILCIKFFLVCQFRIFFLTLNFYSYFELNKRKVVNVRIRTIFINNQTFLSSDFVLNCVKEKKCIKINL